MHLSLTQWTIAVLGIIGPVSILVVMSARSLREKFPIFFNYMAIYAIITSAQLVVALFSCVGYFYVWWGLSLLLMLAEFGVIYEVLIKTIKPYSALIDLAKMLFVWVGLFLLMAAGCTALATAGSEVSRLQAAADIAEHGIRLMQCGLLLFLLLFEGRLGISWRNYGMGIAIGMGIYAATDLAVTYLVVVAPNMAVALQNINGLIYLGVLGFWVSVLTLPEPQRKNVLDSPSRLIFKRWDEALASATFAKTNGEIALSSVDSFIPGVERAVDRVLAKRVAR